MNKYKTSIVFLTSISLVATSATSIFLTSNINSNKVINNNLFETNRQTKAVVDTAFVSNDEIYTTTFFNNAKTIYLDQIVNLKSMILSELVTGTKTGISQSDILVSATTVDQNNWLKGIANVEIKLKKYYQNGQLINGGVLNPLVFTYTNVQFKARTSHLVLNTNDYYQGTYSYPVSLLSNSSDIKNKFPSEYDENKWTSTSMAAAAIKNFDELLSRLDKEKWDLENNPRGIFFYAPSKPDIVSINANDDNGTLSIQFRFSEWIEQSDFGLPELVENVTKTLCLTGFKNISGTGSNNPSSFPESIQVPVDYNGSSTLIYGSNTKPVAIKTVHATPKIFFENYLSNHNINNIPDNVINPKEFLESLYINPNNFILASGDELVVRITSLSIIDDKVAFNLEITSQPSTARTSSNLSIYVGEKWVTTPSVKIATNASFLLYAPVNVNEFIPIIIYVVGALILLLIMVIIIWRVIIFNKKKKYLRGYYGEIY